MSYESSYHTEWQNNRINFILDLYGAEFFKNKRILELGPFNGYIGHRFSLLGATVHCIEGRQENVQNIKVNCPELSIECADLDTPNWKWGRWDIIINFGLYYHLQKNHREHLINCLSNCNLMFFESVIFDSDSPEISFNKEYGVDQSLTDVGGTPSTSYIENIFDELNVTYKKYSSNQLNDGHHRYDWKDNNSKIYDRFTRRFWVVKYD